MYDTRVLFLQVCLLWVVDVGAKTGLVSLNVFRECCPGMPIVIPDKSFMDCIPKTDDGKTAKNGTVSTLPKVSGSCVMECAFTAEGLTAKNATNGKVIINVAALNKLLDKYAVGEWAPIINASKEACVGKPTKPKLGETCVSGTNQVTKCLSSHFINKCPTPNTTRICMRRLSKMKSIISQTGLNVSASSTVVLAKSQAAAAAANSTANAIPGHWPGAFATPNSSNSTTGAPVTTPATVAPVTTPGTVAPVTTPATVAPVTTPTTVAPVTTPTALAPVTTPTTVATTASIPPNATTIDPAFTTDDPSPIVIPNTYTSVPGVGFVRHSTVPKSFYYAKADCKADRATLYVVNTTQRLDYMNAYFNSTNLAPFDGATTSVNIWVGMEKYSGGWATARGVFDNAMPVFQWLSARPVAETKCTTYCKGLGTHYDTADCGINDTLLLPYICQL